MMEHIIYTNVAPTIAKEPENINPVKKISCCKIEVWEICIPLWSILQQLL